MHMFYQCPHSRVIIDNLYQKYAPEFLQDLSECNFIISWNTKNNDKNMFLNCMNKIIIFYLWAANRRKEIPNIKGCDASLRHNAKIIGMALYKRFRYNYMNIIETINQEMVEQDVIQID